MSFSPRCAALALVVGSVVLLPRVAFTQTQKPPSPPIPLLEGFEGSGLPKGWNTRAGEELLLRVLTDSRGVREGRRSLRLHVPVWYGGAAELVREGLPVKGGASYSLEVWLRSRDLEQPVEVRFGPASDTKAAWLARTLPVGPDWRRVVLRGKVGQEDAAGVFSIRFAGSGMLDIDALRLVEGDFTSETELSLRKQDPKADLLPGNHLFNSSLELGAAGWQPPVRAVREAAVDGRQVARISAGSALRSLPFAVRPDAQHTVSLSLRAPQGRSRVEVALEELGGATRAVQTFEVTPEWKRHSFSATPVGERSLRYSLVVRAEGAPVDADALQVEQGPLSDYAPSAAMEAAATLDPRHRSPEPDALVPVPIQVYARGGAPANAAARCRLVGPDGSTRALSLLRIPAGAIHHEGELRLRIPAPGPFVLEAAALVESNVTAVHHELLAAFLTDPAGSAVSVTAPGTAAPILADLLRRAGLTLRPAGQVAPGAAPIMVASPSGLPAFGGMEQARIAAVQLARRLNLARSAGDALLVYPAAGDVAGPNGAAPASGPGLADALGYPKPVLSALSAASAFLSGAHPAGRVELVDRKAYLFQRGEEVLVAVWAPQALSAPLVLAFKGVPAPSGVTGLFGQSQAARVSSGELEVALRPEPSYFRFRGVSPDALAGAIRNAAAPAPTLKPAPEAKPGQQSKP